MKEKGKKKLFISGPITDTPFYWRAFEEAREFYEAKGYAVMNPSELPVGMTNADYARVCLSMIDSADEVVFLPGWRDSIGARLEHDYCYYIRKPVRLYANDSELSVPYPGFVEDHKRAVRLRNWLFCQMDRLEEASLVTEYLSKIVQGKYDSASVKCLRREMRIDELLKEFEFWKGRRVKKWLIDSHREKDAECVRRYMERLEAVGDDDDQVQVLRDLYKIAELEEEYIKAEDCTEGMVDEAIDTVFHGNGAGSKDAEVFSKLMSDTLCKAVDLGFSVTFSEDEDGWRGVSLYPPYRPGIDALYDNAQQEMDRITAKEGAK